MVARMSRQLLRCAVVLSCLAGLALPSPSQAQRRRRATDGPVRITFLVDGEYSAMIGFRTQIVQAIESLVGDRRELDFDPERDRVGDYTLATARAQLDEALAAGDSDMLIVLGALGGIAVGGREELPIPVIVPYTLEPQLAGLPLEDAHSGRTNLAYISDGIDVRNALSRFHDVHPYDRVHVLMSEATETAAPGLADHVRSLSESAGGTVEVAFTTSSMASDIVQGLPDDVTALFLSPLVRLEDGQVRQLLRLTNERAIPVFAFGGRHVCELGALGSITSEDDLIRRARRTATFVERWLDGEALERFDVSFAPTEVLYLNLRAATATGARPSWILLTEAELVGDTRPVASRTLTLPQALSEAVDRNVDLAAADASVDSAQQDVDRARAPLLPQASVSATGALIDEDRSAGLGSPGQLSTNWAATLTQVAYSPRAWGGFEIQQHSRDATVAGRDATRLDVVLEAGEAYVNVLRAAAAMRIRRENLSLTRANLQRARMRVRIGRSSEAEVIRWESSLAGSQRDVLQAFAQLRQAEIELNRVLNRPLGDPVRLMEAEQPAEELLGTRRRQGGRNLEHYLTDPWQLRILTDFLAEEGIRNAPELEQVDAAIRAQRRRLDMSEQVLFAPDISLSATFTHNFLDVGGANPREVPPGIMGFAPIDDFDFQIGLQITLPIYSGGERYADLRQSRAEIRRLAHQRRSVELRVEQGVRSTMAQIAPAYANIELSRRAADAAERNLELVNAAYLAGSVDILRVLDAQTQALTARLSAANAIYDLMITILQAERRSGRFNYFTGPEDRVEFLDRLHEFEGRHRLSQPTRTPAAQEVE